MEYYKYGSVYSLLRKVSEERADSLGRAVQEQVRMLPSFTAMFKCCDWFGLAFSSQIKVSCPRQCLHAPAQ
jgi:hypothetical protein